jgi:hypothetical protein
VTVPHTRPDFTVPDAFLNIPLYYPGAMTRAHSRRLKCFVALTDQSNV